MKTFSAQTRTENLLSLKQNKFDLVIVGGGILGAGIARDAASRGMKVALVEKSDFASGTSSRSSKLIHGGIRYLENLEFGLVFEALNEREKLYELAPHLVHPLRFLLPIYENSRVGYFKMGLGMFLYDILALFQSGLHERLDAEQTATRMPWIKKDGLVGSFVYSDAYMDDDRLVMETLRSAHELGAIVSNYTQAKTAVFDAEGKIIGIGAQDQLDKKNEFQIYGKHVISCVGAWTDEVAPILEKNWKKSLRPTKGIHITLSRERLPLPEAVVMAVDKENRIVFGIPRHEMIIIGTTDTDFKETPDNVVANADDVHYLLKIANEYFPGANLTTGDIIATYAGVRPLVDDGAKTEGKTSREHKIITTEHGTTFVMGGKYTTYRRISEQALLEALKHFSTVDQVGFASNQTETPLNPFCSSENYQRALTLCDSWSRQFHLSLEDTYKLALRHGMETETLLAMGHKLSLTRIEVEFLHALRNTMCINLVDFYTRRYPLFLAEPNHGLEWLDLLGMLAQNELDWSQEELEVQKLAVKNHIARELAWHKNI
jgi:glycerol-3-phosphate dehydrogenase